MKVREPITFVSIFCPGLAASGEILPQIYDLNYQFYQEDSDRIRVEALYLRGEIEFDDATSFRFQWLHDAISGASPTGAQPGGVQPFYADLEDVRTGILGAISRQIGDHRVDFELSHSEEDDYISRGFALSDVWELNQKNTTFTYGINYLDDMVSVPQSNDESKHGYDLFSGVSQIIDKNTILSANLALGYSDGYLNDPYKIVQRTESFSIPDGLGGTIEVPVTNIYKENRPGSRFRQVLQLEGRHYFEPAKGALDVMMRLSNDDFGVFSQTAQIEWRQSVGDHFQVVPFFRYYHQTDADFFTNTIDGINVENPSSPDAGGPNYSADYRLSSFDAVSTGLRLGYRFNDHLSATASYERYVMNGSGSSSNRAPEQAYPNANIWTFGLHAEF